MRKGMLMDQSVCIDVTLAGELSIGAPQMWQKRDRSWSERISIHRKVYKITSCFFLLFPNRNQLAARTPDRTIFWGFYSSA